MIDRIKSGDWVNVFFEHCQPITMAQVMYIPLSQGETWVVRKYDGKLFGVQNFAYMERIKEPVVVEPPKKK